MEVSCTDSSKGMFCTTCQKWVKFSAGWTTRTGAMPLRYATCHKDAAVIASMAQQGRATGESVLELQCSAVTKELAEKKKNREILLRTCRLKIKSPCHWAPDCKWRQVA